MKEYFIVTGTITYAMKAKDILRKNGFYAVVQKLALGEENIGCGYAVLIKGNVEKALEILKNAEVKILKIIPKNFNGV